MTLNGVMADTLRYFTEFGKPVFQHITASACKKASSRSLSHLLMSFLFLYRPISVSKRHWNVHIAMSLRRQCGNRKHKWLRSRRASSA